MTNFFPDAPLPWARRKAKSPPPTRYVPTTKQPHDKSTATPKLSFAFSAVCIMCLTGLILVVHLSDGRSTGTWIPRVPAIQPSVLLSLLATLFNTFEFFILADGLTIVWWRAFQNGATLQKLHYIKWNGVKETWRSLRIGFETRRVFAVLMIASVIRIYDAPLLQRSIKSVLSDQIIEYDSTWMLPASIPEGWAGTVDGTAPAALFATNNIDRTLKEWYTNSTIGTADVCGGICTGPVIGAGVSIECSSDDYVVDLKDSSHGPQSLFQINFNRGADDFGLSVLNMRLLYATETTSQCRAIMATQSCDVRLASVMYDTIQQGSSIALNRVSYPQTLAIQSVLANMSSVDDTPADALAALEYFGYYFLQSNATVSQPSTPGNAFSWEPSGVLPRQYANFDWSRHWPPDNNSCNFRWDNATDDLIWAFHDVMFRIAYTSALGNETGPALKWKEASNELRYDAEYTALWIAVGSMLFSLFTSMSLLWGFWQLDREVSLSPVETARALAEAVLQSPSGNRDMTIDQMLEVFGDRKAW